MGGSDYQGELEPLRGYELRTIMRSVTSVMSSSFKKSWTMRACFENNRSSFIPGSGHWLHTEESHDAIGRKV